MIASVDKSICGWIVLCCSFLKLILKLVELPFVHDGYFYISRPS